MKHCPCQIQKVFLLADKAVLIKYAERPGDKGTLEVWRPNRDTVSINLKLHLEAAAKTTISQVAFGRLGADHLVAVAHYRVDQQEEVVSSQVMLIAVRQPRRYHIVGSIDLERHAVDHMEIGEGALFVQKAGAREVFAVDLNDFVQRVEVQGNWDGAQRGLINLTRT